MPKRTVKVNLYEIVSRAIEDGIALGINHAYKHSDEPISDAQKEMIKDKVRDAIMIELCEVLKFE